MKCQTVLRQKEKRRPTIQARLSCGDAEVFEHKFGVFCAKCETGLYFGMGEKYSQWS